MTSSPRANSASSVTRRAVSVPYRASNASARSRLNACAQVRIDRSVSTAPRSRNVEKASLETLLIAPPKNLMISDYRSGQMSGGVRWLSHPIVRHAASRRLVTDGRAWTCMGPLMISEIERLKAAVK